MGAVDFQTKYIKTVAPFSTHTEDFPVPNGLRVKFEEMGGSLDPKNGSHVKLIWDAGGAGEQIVFIAFNGFVQKTVDEFVGDGVKIFRVQLVNNSPTSEIMGGHGIGWTT